MDDKGLQIPGLESDFLTEPSANQGQVGRYIQTTCIGQVYTMKAFEYINNNMQCLIV